MKAKLYTKNGCPFCVNAKTLLAIRGIQYEEINIQTEENKRQELLEACAKINIIPKTVPQIWLNDEYIGGFDELKRHLEN